MGHRGASSTAQPGLERPVHRRAESRFSRPKISGYGSLGRSPAASGGLLFGETGLLVEDTALPLG